MGSLEEKLPTTEPRDPRADTLVRWVGTVPRRQEREEDGRLSAALSTVRLMGSPESLQGKVPREWEGCVVSTWGSSSTFEGVLQQSRQRTGQWQWGGEGRRV